MRRVFALVFGSIIGFAGWSYLAGGIIHTLLAPGIPALDRLESIRIYFQSWGIAAPLAYVAVVMVEVVIAPIPGVILYLPGGVIFGWLAGGLASLAGNILGGGLACFLSRSLVQDKFFLFAESNTLKKYQALVEERGFWIIFLLRVNPLTSSDIVSYAAGLTRIPLWHVMIATGLGMAPLCFLQAYFAQELFTIFPSLLYPLVLLALAYAVYIIKLSRRIIRPKTAPLREIKDMANKLTKSDDEWKKQLTPEQFQVCRMKGTEPPFTGEYYKSKTPGTYTCSCCGTELFNSETKYESGTGWPSFSQPLSDEAVATHDDSSHGMRRTEVTCNSCGAHLGHVFEDGPKPTGQRYCINSVSLKLKPKE